jgi:hypothetical protein
VSWARRADNIAAAALTRWVFLFAWTKRSVPKASRAGAYVRAALARHSGSSVLPQGRRSRHDHTIWCTCGDTSVVLFLFLSISCARRAFPMRHGAKSWDTGTCRVDRLAERGRRSKKESGRSSSCMVCLSCGWGRRRRMKLDLDLGGASSTQTLGRFLLLPPFGNIRCFSFVKWVYLNIF